MTNRKARDVLKPALNELHFIDIKEFAAGINGAHASNDSHVTKATQAILSALQADILGMMEDEYPKDETLSYRQVKAYSSQWWTARNDLRAEQRKVITDYFEVTG